jgi:hypothetical protein
MVVEFIMENEDAGKPPKLTAVTPVKFSPLMVIVAPLAAETGENEAIWGSVILFLKIVTLNEPLLNAISGLPSASKSLLRIGSVKFA